MVPYHSAHVLPTVHASDEKKRKSVMYTTASHNMLRPIPFFWIVLIQGLSGFCHAFLFQPHHFRTTPSVGAETRMTTRRKTREHGSCSLIKTPPVMVLEAAGSDEEPTPEQQHSLNKYGPTPETSMEIFFDQLLKEDGGGNQNLFMDGADAQAQGKWQSFLSSMKLVRNKAGTSTTTNNDDADDDDDGKTLAPSVSP
jgi:hypothetical protein